MRRGQERAPLSLQIPSHVATALDFDATNGSLKSCFRALHHRCFASQNNWPNSCHVHSYSHVVRNTSLAPARGDSRSATLLWDDASTYSCVKVDVAYLLRMTPQNFLDTLEFVKTYPLLALGQAGSHHLDIADGAVVHLVRSPDLWLLLA